MTQREVQGVDVSQTKPPCRMGSLEGPHCNYGRICSQLGDFLPTFLIVRHIFMTIYAMRTKNNCLHF